MSNIKEIYLRNSNIAPMYLNEKEMVIPSDDANAYLKLTLIKGDIRKFIKDGRNLYICSNYVGNGKTQWACELAKEYINQISNVWVNDGYPVVFINVPEYLMMKKQAFSDESVKGEVELMEHNIMSAKLVIFDDFGDSMNISQYDYNSIYSWINYRTSHLKSCIFTSNDLPEELEEIMPAKLVNRILGYSEQIIFEGGSFRGK